VTSRNPEGFQGADRAYATVRLSVPAVARSYEEMIAITPRRHASAGELAEARRIMQDVRARRRAARDVAGDPDAEEEKP
jgi:hypothetical protein